jgi:peptidyl-prolyl cis-trans isomerase NIMA-interacting 1
MVGKIEIPYSPLLILPAQPQWEVRLSNSRGVPYFFDVETKTSSWEPPAGLTKEQISRLPGADKYLNEAGGKESGGENGKVRASHLLVKHRDSRRPSSWKEVRAI